MTPANPNTPVEMLADHLPLALMQARYALRDFNVKQPGCGFDKLATACELAAHRLAHAKEQAAGVAKPVAWRWEGRDRAGRWAPMLTSYEPYCSGPDDKYCRNVEPLYRALAAPASSVPDHTPSLALVEALEKIEFQSTNHGGWFEQDPFGEYVALGKIATAALAPYRATLSKQGSDVGHEGPCAVTPSPALVEALEWIVEREKSAASAAAREMGLRAAEALSTLSKQGRGE